MDGGGGGVWLNLYSGWGGGGAMVKSVWWGGGGLWLNHCLVERGGGAMVKSLFGGEEGGSYG